MSITNYKERKDSQQFQKVVIYGKNFDELQEELKKHFISFANSKGGEVYFSFSNSGFTTSLKLKELIYRILQGLSARINLVIELIGDENEFGLIAKVWESPVKPVYDKKAGILASSFVRTGKDYRLLSSLEQEYLATESQGKSFDSCMLPSSTIEDLDMESLRKAIPAEMKNGLLLTEELLLEQLGLVLKANFGMIGGIPTIAGILLLGKNILKFPEFNGAFVEIEQNERTTSLSGNLLQQITKLHEKAPKLMKSLSLRNALLIFIENAILHKDYTKREPIRVTIENDSFEIITPGLPPYGMNLSSLQTRKVPRNEKIYYFFKLLGKNQITSSSELADNIEVQTEYLGESLKVNCQLRKEKPNYQEKIDIESKNNSLNSRRKKIEKRTTSEETDPELLPRHTEALKYFSNKEDGVITRKTYEKKFNVSQKTANLDLVKLERLQKITRYGKARSVYYKINS